MPIVEFLGHEMEVDGDFEIDPETATSTGGHLIDIQSVRIDSVDLSDQLIEVLEGCGLKDYVRDKLKDEMQANRRKHYSNMSLAGAW